MSCIARKLIFKKFLCCCDASSEHVCCIIGCLCLFVSFNHLCNFIPFFCLLTAIPHCLIMLVMALAGGLLISGIIFNKPLLLALFPWIMIACILLQVVYGVLLYVSQECLTNILGLLFSGLDKNELFTGVVLGYSLIGVLAGVDFLFSLYALLLISCTVTEIVLKAQRRNENAASICNAERSRFIKDEENLNSECCHNYY